MQALMPPDSQRILPKTPEMKLIRNHLEVCGASTDITYDGQRSLTDRLVSEI